MNAKTKLQAAAAKKEIRAWFLKVLNTPKKIEALREDLAAQEAEMMRSDYDENDFKEIILKGSQPMSKNPKELFKDMWENFACEDCGEMEDNVNGQESLRETVCSAAGIKYIPTPLAVSMDESLTAKGRVRPSSK